MKKTPTPIVSLVLRARSPLGRILAFVTLIIPPPSPHQKLAKLPFCFIKKVREIIAKPIAF